MVLFSTHLSFFIWHHANIIQQRALMEIRLYSRGLRICVFCLFFHMILYVVLQSICQHLRHRQHKISGIIALFHCQIAHVVQCLTAPTKNITHCHCHCRSHCHPHTHSHSHSSHSISLSDYLYRLLSPYHEAEYSNIQGELSQCGDFWCLSSH